MCQNITEDEALWDIISDVKLYVIVGISLINPNESSDFCVARQRNELQILLFT